MRRALMLALALLLATPSQAQRTPVQVLPTTFFDQRYLDIDGDSLLINNGSLPDLYVRTNGQWVYDSSPNVRFSPFDGQIQLSDGQIFVGDTRIRIYEEQDGAWQLKQLIEPGGGLADFDVEDGRMVLALGTSFNAGKFSYWVRNEDRTWRNRQSGPSSACAACTAFLAQDVERASDQAIWIAEARFLEDWLMTLQYDRDFDFWRGTPLELPEGLRVAGAVAAIGKDLIAVRALETEPPREWNVVVYQRDSERVWRVTAVLEATSEQVGPNFGNALAISGQSLFVAASKWDIGRRGNVGVVTRYEERQGIWMPVERLSPPGQPEEEEFGRTMYAFPSEIVGYSSELSKEPERDGALYFYDVQRSGNAFFPDLWASLDLGFTVSEGSAAYDPATRAVTLEGAGDIWGPIDGFRYAYRPFTGDGVITARLDGIEPGSDGTLDSWAKAGIMLRGAFETGAPHAFLLAAPERGLHVQYRPTADSLTQSIEAGPYAPDEPVWLRLERAGDYLTASTSNDGETWTEVAAGTLPLPRTIYAGLAVTGTDLGYVGVQAKATFSAIDVVDELSGYEGEGGANRDDALAGTTPNAHIRIQAFPNPFEQATTLQLDLPRSGTYDVALFDVLGRQVRAWTLDEPAGTTATLALTLAGTAAGTYVVRVRHRESGAMATRRVLQVR